MNDKLQKLYDLYKQKGIISTTDFNTFASASDDQRQKLYDLGVQKGLFNTTDFNTFNTAWDGSKQEPVKKKDSTELASKSEKPTSVSSTKEDDFYTGGLGEKKKETKKEIARPSNVFVGFPGKEKNEYRVDNGAWQRRQPGKTQWTTITNEGSISALNKQFNKAVKPMAEAQKAQVANQAKRVSDLEQRLNQVVTGSLVSQDELSLRLSSDDAVAERLRNAFPGFKFTAKGGMSDRISVVAPTGATMELQLDNWNWDDDKKEAEGLKTFIRANSFTDAEKSSKKLDSIKSQRDKEIDVATNKLAAEGLMDRTQKFLDNPLAPQDPMALVKQTPVAKKEEQAISQKYQAPIQKAEGEYIKAKNEQFKDVYEMIRIDKSIDPKQAYASIRRDDRDIKIIGDFYNNVQKSAYNLDKKQKEEQARINSLAEKVKSGEMTMEEYDAIVEESNASLAAEAKKVSADLKSVSTASRALDKSIGMNYVIEESRGSFGGGMAYKFVEGATAIPRLLSFGDMSKEDQDELVKSITGGDTSTQYVESEKRGDFSKAMFSLAESLGVMASSAALPGIGKAARYAGFFGMSYYEMKDELDNAQFKNKETGKIEKIPERDKVLLSAGYGILSSVLENFGVDLALTKTAFGRNLTNNIMKRAFLGLSKEATEAEIRTAINSSVNSILSEIGVKAGIGAAAEALTEGAQSLSQVGIEEVYDEYRNKDFSKNKGLQEALSNAAYEGYLGAIGGGVMSIAQSSPQALKIGFNSVYKQEELEALINATKIEGINSALVNKLKADLLTGNMSKEEAKSVIESFNKIQGKVRSMPNTLSPKAKAESLELMIEREEIEREVEGKDPNLVKPQKARIAEINSRLEQIGEENAVQEQGADAVPVQSGAGVSTEMEKGVSETKPEWVTGETITEEVKVEGPKAEQPQAEVAKEEIEIRRREEINQRKTEIESDIAKLEDELSNTSRLNVVDRLSKKSLIKDKRKQLNLLESNPKQYFEEELQSYDEQDQVKFASAYNYAKKRAELFSQEAASPQAAVVEEAQQPVAQTEVAAKVEIGGIVRGFETIFGDKDLGDIRNDIPFQSERTGTTIIEKNGNRYAVAWSGRDANGEAIREYGGSSSRPGYISASVKIDENATPEQINAAQKEAERNLKLILPTITDGKVNPKTINDLMSQQQPVVQETVQAEVQKLPEAQPNQRFEFTPETLPDQLKNVEPEMGVTEVRKRLFGKKEKAKLVFSGQQLIDAGLAVAPGTKQEVNETIQERPIVSEQGRETGRGAEGQVATGVQPTNKREGVKKSLEQLRDSGLLVSAQKGQNAMTNEEIDALMSLSDAMASVWAETTGNDNFYETFIDEVKAGDIEAIKEKGGILFQNVEIPQAPISRVSLAVFNLPEFKKMQGTNVALQNIKDMIKSRGKDIEKDIINRVLDFDKYQGVKRVDFDEFKNDVDLQVMKLEKIETTTYADYGMNNLGNNETYGVAETIVYNSPVDHGQKGHFGGDFISNKLKPRNWEVRELPGTNQYIAIDADVPAGLVGEQLMPYVGTAGNKQSVEKWIENRNRTSQNSELNVGLFGHIRGWYHEARNRYYLAEAQSDYFQKNKASDLYRTIIDKTKLKDLMSIRMLEQKKKIINQFEEETGYRTQVDFFPDITKFNIYKDANLIYQFEFDNGSYAIEDENDAQENAINFLTTALKRMYKPSFIGSSKPIEGIELGKKIWMAENNKTQFPNESELEEEIINTNREKRKWKDVRDSVRNNRDFNEAEDKINELNEKSQSLQREIENIPSDSDLLDLAYQSFLQKSNRIDDEMNNFAQELSREVTKLEEKLIDEAKNSKEGDLILKQFIASQKVHEIRLFREAVKHAAEVGATELWFPSPYTLALIEGYVSGNGTVAPYEITSSRYNDELNPGDTIDYAEEEYVVIDSDRDSFKAAPRDYVSVYYIHDYIDSEVNYYVYEALKSDFNKQFGDGISQKDISKYQENESYSHIVLSELIEYRDSNPDQDTILWDDIEEAVADRVRNDLYYQDPSDLFGGARVYNNGNDTYYVVDNSNWEMDFQQPNEYDTTDASNFESELSGTQKTVVNKYKEFNKYIQKSRPDSEFVVDDNGRTWLKTNITQDDLINPIIAFQNEGGRIKGAIDFQNDNKASVYIFDGADISTLAHEITGHLGRRVLEKLSEQDENFAKDYQAAMDWAGVVNGEWSVAADEKFARGFEKYLRDGKAPTAALKNVFEKLRSWLINIYRKIKGSSIDIELTPEITAVFDNLLRPQKEAKVEQLRGFDRMMSELDGIIEKSRKRRASEEKVFENAMNYLQGSAVYERATDVQREQMVRDLRKKFGKREKSAPSVKKLFGEVKDVKKITMPEYDLMVKQIMDFEKGAKTTLAKVTKASKELTAYVKEMVKKGHITTNQAVSVLRRFSATNLLDENSVSNFVNYMRKVFNDAEYANKIANVRKKLPTAKKNIKTKIGVAKDLAPLMERVFAINPSIIPDEVFNKYSDAVMMMGERAAVLNLKEYSEIKENLIDVIDAVEMEAGLAEELVGLFNDNKVVEEGKLNFSETLNKMFEDGLINEYEKSLMKKYKSLFTEKKEKESKKEEKVKAAKEAVASATINTADLPTKNERDVAKKLAKLVKAKAYEMLTDDEVIQLSKVINNINNGFLTHKAEQLRERMSGLVKAKDLISPIQQVKVMFGELLKGNLKSKVTGENVYTNIIKGNSAAFIDEVFGNFKERPFFNNIYEPIAQAIQRFTDENKIIRDKVDKLENDLLRHFKGNGREATKSKFKMMTYMLQVENDSNPDSKQVNPAQAFIDKTIQKIENGTTSMYTDRDAKELQDISDKYGKVIGKDDKGNDIIEIDSNKLYNSFSTEEKRILKGLRDINDSMTEKAEFTAAVIRGNRINPINNYISLSTISDDTGNDQFSSIVDIRKMFDSTRQASTKAKSLIERTGRVSAINFDPFSSVRKSSSAVLMDYNMTPTIRESRIALKQLEKDVKEGVLDKSKRDFVNALRDSFDLIVDSAIGNNMLQGTFEDAVIAELSKQGYRTMLASVERSMGELISNAAFVTFVAPVTWAKGTAYSKFLMSSDFFNLLNNVGSTQTSRIKPGNTLSNRMVDTSILQQATGLKGASVKSEIRNRAEQIYNLTGKKVKNVAELTADTLISTPDKIMMQPLWMGTFASEFKKEAGVEVDVNKLAANDEAYMDKYADAIEKARREADDITVRAGSTDNAALTVLRNTITPEQKASRFWKWYKTFNGFMSKFLLFEYMTARSAIYQLAKDGRISKREAVSELAAVTARMTMYSVVISMLGESVIDMAAGLLGYRDDEDDEEEKKKTLAQEASQGLASTFTTMMFGRNFGNVARAPINIGVEYLNEKYLDFLRNGEYDPYTDQLQYTIAPKEGSKDPFLDVALNTVGPISPFYKTGRFIGKYMYAPEGKTEDKKERQRKEKWRVALEVPGALGFVPFYNNIRKVQQDWIYGDLGRAEKITSENIESKLKSAKSAMTRDINEAIKMRESRDISKSELKQKIREAEKEYVAKIKDYRQRLR